MYLEFRQVEVVQRRMELQASTNFNKVCKNSHYVLGAQTKKDF